MSQQDENLHYVGSFSTLQTEGRSRYQDLSGAPTYTAKQNELYSRLLIGLKYYTPEQKYAMNSNKKKRIAKTHKKAQDILNLWKQEITIEKTNGLFSQLFPKAEITKVLIKESDPSTEFRNTLSFKDLGIRKEDIVEKFLEKRLLPANFYEL
jgi:hypothetical protein